MELLIIRHAHCVAQVDPALLGDHDCELTEIGRRQAEVLAEALSTGPLRPTRLFASPLVRAIDTAIPTAKSLGLPITVRADLREVQRMRGQLGQGRKALLARHTDLIFDDSIGPEGWSHGDVNYQAVTQRVSGVLDSVLATSGLDDRTAVFTHGAFAGLLVDGVLGVDPQRPTWFVLENVGVTALRFPEPGRPGFGVFPPHSVQILMLNSVEHLDPSLRTPDPTD